MPDIPDAVRLAVRRRHGELGNAAFHISLAQRDPQSAAKISSSDPQRMIRAMEVIEATGRSLSAWQAEPAAGPPPGLRFRTVLLLPPREEIYAAIEERFDRMVTAGGLPEVTALAARGLDPDLPVMKALGVPDLAAYARGELDFETAATRAKTAIRNYAKRQITWFKGQMVANVTFITKFSERFKEQMLSKIL